MNSFIVVFAVALAVASAGVIAPLGTISQTVIAPAVKDSLIQGPSTSSHIVGPDGSQIVAIAPGGQIRTSETVGVATKVITPVAAPVAYAAPVASVVAPVAYAAPVAPVAPVVTPLAAQTLVAKTLLASPVVGHGYSVVV